MNPVKHSPDTLTVLNFYPTSLALLTPCTSLLADVCHLSIPEVRHALPSMVKAVIYQAVNFSQSHGQTTFIQEILQSKSLLSIAFLEKQGINFTQLERLSPEFTPFRLALFAEKQENFAWLMGLLADRTGLTVQKVVGLFDKVALLTLKLLADIRTLAITSANQGLIKTPLTDKAFFNWLNLQPMLMASLADKGLMTVLGYQFEQNLGQLLNEQANFYKNNALKNNPLNPELTSLATLIAHYQTTQPLGIIPNEFLAKPKRPFTTPSAKPLALAPAIFIADTAVMTQKPTWQQRLQRHWMLTAGVLTGLVFGGIALLSPVKDKPKAITPEQALNEAKAMPHDVAIIRVDSAPTAIENTAQSTQTATSATPQTAVKSQPKADTPTDNKKTATKPSSPTKEKDKSADKKPSQDKAKSSQKTDKTNPDKINPNKNSKDTKKDTKETSNKKVIKSEKPSVKAKTTDKTIKKSSEKS